MELFILWLHICSSSGDKFTCSFEKQADLKLEHCESIGKDVATKLRYSGFISSVNVNWVCSKQGTERIYR